MHEGAVAGSYGLCVELCEGEVLGPFFFNQNTYYLMTAAR